MRDAPPRRVLLPVLVLTSVLLPAGHGGHAASLDARDLLRCQAGLERAAARLTTGRAALLARCLDGLVACRLASEIDGAPLAPCEEAAATRCTGQLQRASALDTTFTRRVSGRCAIPDRDARGRRGLGFRDAADACATLVPPASVATTDDALACVRRSAACAADDLVEEQSPRAHELLDAIALAAAAPCVDPRPPASGASGATGARILARCQRAIAKESLRTERLRAHVIRTCAGALLRCDLPADRLETDLAGRAACRGAVAAPCARVRARLATQEAKRDARLASRCGGVTVGDLAHGLGFAVRCGGATTVDEVTACLASELAARTARAVGIATPRACALLRAAGELGDFADVCVPSCGNGIVEAGESCDDGNADPTDRCTTTCTPGPVGAETVVLASGATPPHVPDGTAGTAVPADGTLATQFGSTLVDLNRTSYTRHFALGGGPPEAVLVLVPGFVAGAGTFRVLAERLIVRAEAAGGPRLEVWAVDRRTNLLEDRAGTVLAAQTLDPLRALAWFFGAQVGLPPPPALGRHAVFHAGQDLAFLAELTPHVFARDLDAVIEAARALPSAPAVFLGGHSLGTLFAGRYAATDFDPGPGVAAGFAKIAGLVLMEGGGGAVPASPPSSAALDAVIAKADGGLFHAVREGAPRCVDGTPCSADADCAGVPLPAGALTNRCVAPVAAFTGAATGGVAFINPEIQAAGNIAGIQGVLDPDGLVAVQQDFGIGSAVRNVARLGILAALPPAATTAGLGFFLDDDFSPVSAFRISVGYSSNGPNTTLLGLVLPLASTQDPYRLWIDFDAPQPSQAVPHNGPATATLGAVWGQEREVSSLPRFLPSLFADDTDLGDWYFAASGLSVTSELDPAGAFGGLDSTALSVGRGRPDIENLTHAGAIDVPVIAFGGSNGLTPTAASFRAFATGIGPCAAPSCSGATPRLVADDPITPTFGDVAGGFEVYIAEGWAHIDVVTAEDIPGQDVVLGPLLDFLARNTP